ncbi:hypothetical protein [Streptomyces meridianus]|uniref:Metal-binding protein n=1 Tax=Streptomyces meridianus TaxID=2938945 RepID=A0ABT0X2J4_9ACTN|nr:hypothetical protein [Streptomyces meridianus]MCM2576153.1 hypothetical protein [Streptomyces meridianus]
MSEKTPPPAGPAGREQTIVCALCRVASPASPPPLSWICSLENGVRTYCCQDCARANIRAIEGRLDTSWW